MELVLLHGLGRTGRSMRSMAVHLAADGHSIHVITYTSTKGSLLEAAEDVSLQLRARGLALGGPNVGFVAHSMGGIILRALPMVLRGFSCGPSVLLGTPYNGSIIAERCADHPVMEWLFGPALADLSPSRVKQLPDVPGPFGVIAGRKWNPLLPSAHIIQRLAPDEASDSTVLIREALTPAARQTKVIDRVHTFLADSSEAQDFASAFLATGMFTPVSRDARSAAT